MDHQHIKLIVIPDNGNLITEKDIEKRKSIRITARFKHLFPTETTTFKVSASNIEDECKFEYRPGKSHYIHLSESILSELNLREGDSLLIIKEGHKLDLTTIRTLTLQPISKYDVDYKKERVIVIFTSDKGIHIGYRNFDGKWYDEESNSYDTVNHFAKLPPNPIDQPDGVTPHLFDSWNRLDARKNYTARILADKFPFVLLFDHGEIVSTDSESYWFDSKGNTFPEIKHWIGINIRRTR